MAPGDLTVAGQALQLVDRLAGVARALGAALGEGAAVGVHRDAAVDQDPVSSLSQLSSMKPRPRRARTSPTFSIQLKVMNVNPSYGKKRSMSSIQMSHFALSDSSTTCWPWSREARRLVLLVLGDHGRWCRRG